LGQKSRIFKEGTTGRKRYQPEQIISKLRKVEALPAAPEAVKSKAETLT